MYGHIRGHVNHNNVSLTYVSSLNSLFHYQMYNVRFYNWAFIRHS